MPSPGATKLLIDAAISAAVIGALLSQSNVFYVNSGHALKSDTSGKGQSPDAPFATLDYAIGQCTASVGDVIIVAAGHAESISAADGINADVAGITIIGQGSGTNKPTFTMGTATTATFGINAANVTVRNLRFVNNIDSLAIIVDVDASNATIIDCDFVGSSTKEFLCGIDMATGLSDITIEGCTFYQPTDPAGTDGNASTGAIFMLAADRVRIRRCGFYGFFETAFIHNKTGDATNLWVEDCHGICSLSGAEPFLLVTTSTGGAVRCSFITPAEAATTEATLSGTFGAGFFNFLSYFGNDGGGGQLAIASQAAAS